MGTCPLKSGAEDSCLPVIHHFKVSSLWKGGHMNRALCYSLLASGGPDPGPPEDSSEAGVRAMLSSPPPHQPLEAKAALAQILFSSF